MQYLLELLPDLKKVEVHHYNFKWCQRDLKNHKSRLQLLALASIASSAPGTWEPLSLSRTSLYPLLQAPRCKKIQYPFPCWTYGLIGRNQDNPRVTVFSLASTIQRLGHAALLLVGARRRGPDTDKYIQVLLTSNFSIC